MLAGAHDFPKFVKGGEFVKGGAARKHELRKVGTGASRDGGLRNVLTVRFDKRG
jgi:hypothetical protein